MQTSEQFVSLTGKLAGEVPHITISLSVLWTNWYSHPLGRDLPSPIRGDLLSYESSERVKSYACFMAKYVWVVPGNIAEPDLEEALSELQLSLVLYKEGEGSRSLIGGSDRVLSE